MTVRLIGLMCVVLLLSLAAFGLSVSYYQDKLMDEVARTASAVGKATLRTFEFEGRQPSRFEAGGDMIVWAKGAVDLGPAATDVSAFEFAPYRSLTRRIQALPGDDGQVEVTEVTCHETAATEGEPDCVTRQRLQAPVMVVDALASDDPEGKAGNHFIIRIDDIHTEAVDDTELVLTIPRIENIRTDELQQYAFSHFSNGGEWTSDPAVPRPFPDREALRLPISTDDYDKLFSEMRTRSLFLFLGVFVVGTALSAGLATRFTRPIRKLDVGLRKISDGDLDVEVAEKGQDEMARLATAFNEMTRRLRANRDRSRELVRREKLTAVGRLAAGVAHDVRNPLHSIGLTLDHLQDSCRPDEAARSDEFDRSLEIIRGEIRRLDGLVANFLRFTASESGDRGPVDLAALLEETARLVRKEAEWRNVTVEVDTDGVASPTVCGDGEALRSSVLNLVLNSFEAMPDGGRLQLGLSRTAGRLTVDVRDSGRGIPESDREKVFEFGYTTREGGHGLGLAMVHQTVVEDHGGRIDLDSRVGEGTRVRLQFPDGEGGES